ncbi:MAG: type II toxin-antitoxin system VapC family toxin [Thermoplasmata archaeon]|nr:MAG: type II toxin-antitoxin system VapC family toxin [Thermoplasmata archaeon]
MKLVLDSSVIAKLFFKEAGSDSAIKLMEIGDEKDIEFLASDLVIYEVGNTIWKNLRRKNKDGGRYIKLLFLLNIDFISIDDSLASEALDVAQRYNITYYDGVHMVVGKKNKATLVTQDKVLLKKFKSTSSIKEVLERIE